MLNYLQKNTKPKNLNQSKIFNSDAPLIRGFIILGFLCQLWSFLSEFIGLNQYLIEMATLFMPEYWANITGNALAFLLALTIEISVFAAVTYIVNCLYNGYIPFKWNLSKVERGNWLKFLIGFGVTVFIIIISITISKKNIELQTKTTPPKAKIEDTSPLKEQLEKDIAKIEKRYKTDKQNLEDSYQESKSNIISLYAHRIDQKESDITNLKRKEERTGKKFTTARENTKKAIKAIREQQTKELIKLKNSHDNNLAKLFTNRNNDMAIIKDEYATDKQKITNSNDAIVAITNERNEWLSNFLKLYAGYSVIGFLLCRIWVVISFNTCGIQPRLLVKSEFFESGIIKDFFTLIYTFPSRHLHNLIRKGLEKVPELKEIKGKGAVIDISANNTELTLSQEEQNEYNNLISELLKQPELPNHFNKNGLLNSINTDIPRTVFKANTEDLNRVIIKGFEQSSKYPQNLLEQEKTHTNNTVIKTVHKEDKWTIKHIDRKTGETKFYNLSQVNNFIKNYESRVKESKQKGKFKTMESRQKTLDYWKERKEELLQKINN